MGTSKDELRRSLRQVRDSIPPQVAEAAATAAAEHLGSLPALAGAGTVAIYAPVRRELDPGPAARLLRRRGAALAYPRVLVDERRLSFHLVSDEGALRPGTFGILEPDPALPSLALDAIDAFLVPGLAFDRTGNRLGWGRGYYDRTLAAVPGRLRVGYCFARQVVGHVPREPCDLPVHHIVTEIGIITPAGPQGG